MVLFFVPQVTGIARNQEVNSKTVKAKNVFYYGKVIFCWDPKKIAVFFFLVLKQMY